MKRIIAGVKAIGGNTIFLTVGYCISAAIGSEQPIFGALGGSLGALWYLHFLHTGKQDAPDSQKG